MCQHYQLIEKDSDETKSEMVQHHKEKRWQCLFDPSNAIILDVETDRRKRLLKESIYSDVFQSINKRIILNDAWRTILNKNAGIIRKKIALKETNHIASIQAACNFETRR